MNPSMDHNHAGGKVPSVKGHVRYEPISHFSFNRMLKNIDWNFNDSTFLDFGCGKGAAILLASRYGFKKHFGVEYSRELADICQSNILKFIKLSKREIDYEIICSDATRYLVPADVNVFYFFNPFDQPLLDVVLQNIEQSLKSLDRDILLLYFNAMHKDVIEKYGYSVIYDQRSDKINIWYEGGNYAYIKRAAAR
jgi:SAM-dependent methyltransferase